MWTGILISYKFFIISVYFTFKYLFIVGNNSEEVKRDKEEIDLVCTKENEEYKNVK